jgi:hypothetical protein
MGSMRSTAVAYCLPSIGRHFSSTIIGVASSAQQHDPVTKKNRRGNAAHHRNLRRHADATSADMSVKIEF